MARQQAQTASHLAVLSNSTNVTSPGADAANEDQRAERAGSGRAAGLLRRWPRHGRDARGAQVGRPTTQLAPHAGFQNDTGAVGGHRPGTARQLPRHRADLNRWPLPPRLRA